VIDVDKNFMLYFTTKLHNPVFLPDITTNVTLVDFIVTIEGLEEQLLGNVVSHEVPELEYTLHLLNQNMASDKKKIRAIEDEILAALQT
jgi:dynein heavy chain